MCRLHKTGGETEAQGVEGTHSEWHGQSLQRGVLAPGLIRMEKVEEDLEVSRGGQELTFGDM